MKAVKPKKLLRGDLVGVISPASSPDDLTKINKGVAYLENLGYKVVVGKNVGKIKGYLAGTDKERLDDIHQMFADKEVKAIFNVRGGYGSLRLLDKIDYDLVKKNPKIFVGYSDINALQLAFFKKCGLVTFSGPMPAVDFIDDVSPFTEENFWRIVTSDKKIGKFHNPNDEKFFQLTKGKAEGRILGGNLTVLNSMIGTNYLPDFDKSILMLEDINEPPYKIDRMFNQLRITKLIKKINGIILGRFVNCYEPDEMKNSLTLNEVIEDYFHSLKIPVIYNFKHGHIKDNLTVPLGIKASMNSDKGIIEIKESAVV
jgi:muramoyltetrapeptide carboxypeptidase